MESYISIEKNLIDHIIATGDNISDIEQILYILRGLGVYYNSIVTNLTQKKWVSSLDEVFNKLRIHVKFLERQNGVTT